MTAHVTEIHCAVEQTRPHYSPCGCSQGRVSGPPQGDPPTIRHEKDKPSEPGAEEPDPAGLRRTRHPHLCGEPLCRLHVLLI